LPDRIIKHLKKLDVLRDKVDEDSDKMMGVMSDKVDDLLKNPRAFLRAISIEFLKENKGLFSQARKEGKELQRVLRASD
jgi:hypothetical protein